MCKPLCIDLLLSLTSGFYIFGLLIYAAILTFKPLSGLDAAKDLDALSSKLRAAERAIVLLCMFVIFIISTIRLAIC